MSVKFFGQYLLEKGKITREQLLEAVEHQKSINVSLGTVALEKGMLNPDQINKIHFEQRKTDKKFGELAVTLGLLTADQVDQILKAQMSRHVYLGEALVKKGFLTLEQLDQALKQYESEQAKDKTEISSFLLRIKNTDLVEAYVDLTVKMFLRMAREIVKVSGCHTSKSALNFNQWSFSQNVHGDMPVNFILDVSQELFFTLAGAMMQKEIKEPSEEAIDAVKEFVNIVTGNACARLSLRGLKLRPEPPKANNNSEKKFQLAPDRDMVAVPILATRGFAQIILEL